MATESKSCWLVCLPGRKPFFMVGAKMDFDEALAAARVIWPEAEVK
ncbi:hypothetical protein [Pseudomonas phage Itty13]|jgi:hypothetical protein|uniref:Uncharacterized protein n=1 Tax=Pseudomonas phage Itty13 TaxID=2805750 RepID=A0A889IRT3_9CAUD|nr:hypothetical protein PQC19_gp77 [Pseudomonas phage Itty13]QRE00653.1 hypothetical protein [Pseudomonas phage Itty13]